MKTLQARTRTEARAERDAFLAKLRRGEVAPPSKHHVRVRSPPSSSRPSRLSSLPENERSGRSSGTAARSIIHVIPVLGTRAIQKITADQLAALIGSRRTSALAPWTILGIITPMRRVFALAVRRGYIAENPVLRLHHDELPRGRAQSEPRTLTATEVRKLLAAAPERYRPLLAIAAFTGMRIQEILGLAWGDIDFRERVIRVRAQLSRGTKTIPPRRVDLKTKAGRRDIALAGELEQYLREHLRATELATGLPRRGRLRVHDIEREAAQSEQRREARPRQRGPRHAGLNRDDVPKLGFHDLRHTFASHLIRAGIDPVRASRQLGHARPSITLDIYAHEFDHARGLDDVRDSIDAAFGASRI